MVASCICVSGDIIAGISAVSAVGATGGLLI